MYFTGESMYSYRTDDMAVILSRYDAPSSLYDYEHILEYHIKKPIQYEIAEWCDENCQGDWMVGIFCASFTEEADLLACILRWK